MKRDHITWIYRFCYLLLCILPILYISLLFILNRMGYSLRIFPKQCMYTGYILLLIVTMVLRMIKPKRLFPAIIMILYGFIIGAILPKGSETLVIYQDTLCVSKIHEVWLKTYPWVKYHRVENWFLLEDCALYSYRLFR